MERDFLFYFLLFAFGTWWLYHFSSFQPYFEDEGDSSYHLAQQLRARPISNPGLPIRFFIITTRQYTEEEIQIYEDKIAALKPSNNIVVRFNDPPLHFFGGKTDVLSIRSGPHGFHGVTRRNATYALQTAIEPKFLLFVTPKDLTLKQFIIKSSLSYDYKSYRTTFPSKLEHGSVSNNFIVCAWIREHFPRSEIFFVGFTFQGERWDRERELTKSLYHCQNL